MKKSLFARIFICLSFICFASFGQSQDQEDIVLESNGQEGQDRVYLKSDLKMIPRGVDTFYYDKKLRVLYPKSDLKLSRNGDSFYYHYKRYALYYIKERPEDPIPEIEPKKMNLFQTYWDSNNPLPIPIYTPNYQRKYQGKNINENGNLLAGIKSEEIIGKKYNGEGFIQIEKNKSKETIDSLSQLLEIATENKKSDQVKIATLGILTLLLASIGIIQRRKALIKNKLGAYKTNIWQEFGHVQSNAILETYYRMEEKGVNKNLLKPIDSMFKLMTELLKSLQTRKHDSGIEIIEEIGLVKSYLNHISILKEHEISFEIIGEVPDIKVPPIIFYSCAINAVQHGNLLKLKNGKIGIEILKYNKGFICNIYDNGKGFPETINSISDIKEGTGLKNVNRLLKFFNKSRKNNFVTFGSCDEYGYTNKVSLTIL